MVAKLHIDRRLSCRHSAGHVYLRFDNKEAAMNAQRGMHMRWFARRLISAVFMVMHSGCDICFFWFLGGGCLVTCTPACLIFTNASFVF